MKKKNWRLRVVEDIFDSLFGDETAFVKYMRENDSVKARERLLKTFRLKRLYCAEVCCRESIYKQLCKESTYKTLHELRLLKRLLDAGAYARCSGSAYSRELPGWSVKVILDGA